MFQVKFIKRDDALLGQKTHVKKKKSYKFQADKQVPYGNKTSDFPIIKGRVETKL